MLYFAYGSNLSFRRLRARAPSAKVKGTFYLPKFDLLFHKRGRDGSGKCDAFYTGREMDVVHGRVFEISQSDKAALDLCEGLGRGYELKQVEVQGIDNQTCTAIMYVATNIEHDLLPFCWYRRHVLVGAKEAKFPSNYIEQKILVTCRRDTDSNRRETELSLYK